MTIRPRGALRRRLRGWAPWWLLGASLVVGTTAAVTLGRPPAPDPLPVVWDPRRLQTGDLLFRRGRDLASDVVLASDPDSRFSHVGIVVRLSSALLVVHTVPEEGDRPGVARDEPVGDFLAPDAAAEAAIFRLGDAPESVREAAARAALGFARQRIPFDDRFRLDTPREMYCTELVWRAYREAGIDLLDSRLDLPILPFHDGPLLLPSTLMRSPRLVLAADFLPPRRPS